MRSIDAITCVHAGDEEAVLAALAAEDWRVYRFDGSGAGDRDSLLEAIRSDLPLPEGMTPGNWDGLADAVWNMLYDAGGDRFAFVWVGAQDLARRDMQVFLEAVRVFTNLTRSLAGQSSFPRPAAVVLVLVGDDPAFAAWS